MGHRMCPEAQDILSARSAQAVVALCPKLLFCIEKWQLRGAYASMHREREREREREA